MNELKIFDIKPLEQIPDYSFYIFCSIILLIVFIVCYLVYLVYKKFFNKKKTEKQLALEILKEIDLNNSKASAYAISKYGFFFKDDERCKKLYDELNETLEKYKYKKDVDSFDTHTKEQFRRFMDAIDV